MSVWQCGLPFLRGRLTGRTLDFDSRYCRFESCPLNHFSFFNHHSL